MGFSLLVQEILQDGFGIDPDEFFSQDAIQQVNVAGVDAVAVAGEFIKSRGNWGLVQSATVLLPPIRVKLIGVAGPPRPGSGSRPSNPVRRTDLTCLPGRRFGSAKIFSLSRSMWTTPLDAADAVPRLACPLSVLLNSLSFQEKKCEVG